VSAVVWECGEGQSDTQTAGRGKYTFRLGYASREMYNQSICQHMSNRRQRIEV